MLNRYSEKDYALAISKHGLNTIEFVDVSDVFSVYNSLIEEKLLDYPKITFSENGEWFMPKEYKELDIETWILSQCSSDVEIARVNHELEEFRKRNLILLLCQMKYIIDTLRKNNIVWGVGRGSSVSSYVLYLLGVHKVDSIKYNLPLNEFFKGENNG